MQNKIEFWNIEKGVYKLYTNSPEVKDQFVRNGFGICCTYFDPCEGKGWDFVIESKQLKSAVKEAHNLLKKLEKQVIA
jgi:hypothetical protein